MSHHISKVSVKISLINLLSPHGKSSNIEAKIRKHEDLVS
jgi:hypothetical protein